MLGPLLLALLLDHRLGHALDLLVLLGARLFELLGAGLQRLELFHDLFVGHVDLL